MNQKGTKFYKKAGKYLDDNRKCCILAFQYKRHSL